MDNVNKSLRPVARPRSKTGEETKYGRPMWEDEATGDLFSEKTVTVPYGDGFVVMPSVAEDGSELTEDQIFDYVRRNGPIDFMTGEKLPIFESMEEADAYAQKRSETMFTDEDPTPRIDDSMSDMGSEEDGTSMMDVGKSILKLGIAGAQLAGKKMGMDISPTEDNPYGFAKGGQAMSLEKQMSLFEEGGIADDGMDVDPVSGNEVPPGSMAIEVRDDIPAQLSEGEYVVPADVVRFFGVRFFEQLRSEAKQGLGEMEANGRIGGEPVPAGGPMSNSNGALTEEEMAVIEQMGLAMGGYIPQQPPMRAVGNTGYPTQGFAPGGDVTLIDREGIASPSYTGTSLQSEFPLGYSIFGTQQASQVQTPVLLYGPNNEVVSLMLPRDQSQYDALLAQGYNTNIQKAEEQEKAKVEEEFGGGADPSLGDATPGEGTGGIFGGGKSMLDGLDDISGNGTIGPEDTWAGDLVGLDGKIGVQGPSLKDSWNGARRSGLDKGGKGKGKGSGKGTGFGSGFQSRDTDNIGRGDFAGLGLSTGEVFGGDGRSSTSTAPEGFGLGRSGSGISTAPSTTGMSMGETVSGGGGRGVTGTAPEGFGIGGGEGPSAGQSGGTSGGSATGGGGADSGTGPSGGNASPGASGVGAPGVAGGEVGAGPGGTDAVGPMNKGGLASRRKKKK